MSMKEASDETLTSALLESPDGIAELFSSAANTARVRMMALLMVGEQGLNDLMRVTGLSKNAAVNHLTKLMGMGMVRRVGRGRYALTEDGHGLILTGTRLYMGSHRREERERLRQQHSKGRGEEKRLGRRTVGSKGTYLRCWTSFNGAVGGALRAQGLDCDIVDVAGRSGYAFLLNVPKGRMCPSAPTSLGRSVYQEFARGVSELGIGTEIWMEEGGYVKGETISEADLQRARDLFNRVKAEIDRLGRPVVLWGLPIPEFGIVNGYEGTNYLASTFRSHDMPEKEELVPSLDIKAPGALKMMTFGGNAVGEERWLERVVLMASGKAASCEGYLSGPMAAQEWSSVLLRADDGQYFGNSYSAACYAEGLSNAESFLKRMVLGRRGRGSLGGGALFKGFFMRGETAGGLDRSVTELEGAAAAYSCGARTMQEYVRLFPFKTEGHFDDDSRIRGSELLLELKDHEDRAMRHLQEALRHR